MYVGHDMFCFRTRVLIWEAALWETSFFWNHLTETCPCLCPGLRVTESAINFRYSVTKPTTEIVFYEKTRSFLGRPYPRPRSHWWIGTFRLLFSRSPLEYP